MPEKVLEIEKENKRDFKIACDRIVLLRGVTDNKTNDIEELMRNKFSEITKLDGPPPSSTNLSLVMRVWRWLVERRQVFKKEN